MLFFGLLIILSLRYKGKMLHQSLYLFLLIFTSGLKGGLWGSAAGLIMGSTAYLLTPLERGTLFSIGSTNFGKIINFAFCFSICLLIGIMAGVIDGTFAYFY